MSEDKIVDGVMLDKFIRKTGKYYNIYRQFSIAYEQQKYTPFQVGHVYPVITNGLPGFAQLKSIYHLIDSNECYCIFRLYHKAAYVPKRQVLWRPKEDELIAYEQDIRLRCKNVLSWLRLPHVNNEATTKSATAPYEIVYSSYWPSICMKLRRKTSDMMKHPFGRQKLNLDIVILSHHEYCEMKHEGNGIVCSQGLSVTQHVRNDVRGGRAYFSRYSFHDERIWQFCLLGNQGKKDAMQQLKDTALLTFNQTVNSGKRKRDSVDNLRATGQLKSSYKQHDVVGNILCAMEDNHRAVKMMTSNKKPKMSVAFPCGINSTPYSAWNVEQCKDPLGLRLG